MSLNIVNSFKLSAPLIGGWVELGRTILGSPSDTISVASLPDKKYYMVLKHIIPSGSNIYGVTLNSDTGTNYAQRHSFDGAADNSEINSQRGDEFAGHIAIGNQALSVGYIANLSNKEKLVINYCIASTALGAATVPDRQETVWKWANTASPIDEISAVQGSTGDFGIGSEVVVLEWSPEDVHTDNFWEELASVDLSSGTAASISSGIFTAKKYIWIQYLIKGHTDVSSFDGYLRFGSTTIDSGNNYSWRESTNGAADSTSGGATNRILSQTGFLDSGQTMFGNFFIINNASNEKLVTGNIVGSAASGPGTAPNRRESIGKFANTSNQLDIVELGRQGGSGSFATATTLKVWGSD